MTSFDSFKLNRTLMVQDQLMARGINDPFVLEAMSNVPREKFVLPKHKNQAYMDNPLPIGYGQTISQPYMVARMAELLKLKKNDKVLEIGGGSGYAAAVISRCVEKVYTLEILSDLADFARENLKKANIDNVDVICADGRMGYEEEAPYDVIVTAAFNEDIPEIFVYQIKDGGRILMPIGNSFMQKLVLLEKKNKKIIRTEYDGCIFVPLI